MKFCATNKNQYVQSCFVIETSSIPLRACHTHKNRKTSSESFIVGLWEVLKQRFTKSTKLCFCCKIVCRFIRSLLDISSVGLHVEFRHLLPQFGGPQLLEDVVGKDANECCKCYGDRGVPNCKLISSWVIDIKDSPNQNDQVQSKRTFQGI